MSLWRALASNGRRPQPAGGAVRGPRRNAVNLAGLLGTTEQSVRRPTIEFGNFTGAAALTIVPAVVARAAPMVAQIPDHSERHALAWRYGSSGRGATDA